MKTITACNQLELELELIRLLSLKLYCYNLTRQGLMKQKVSVFLKSEMQPSYWAKVSWTVNWKLLKTTKPSSNLSSFSWKVPSASTMGMLRMEVKWDWL